MKQALVSIAIPAYKATFLKRAIDSVLSQSYSNIELIIVNDKSPEDIQTIINSYKDTRIRYYINEQNIGGTDPAKNWNKCLSYANGEFFSLLCDDDLYAPTFVETMLKLAEKYTDTNVFRARVKIIDGENNIIGLYPSVPEYESSLNYMVDDISGFRRQTISEFLYRTEHIKANGGYSSLPKAWCSDHLSVFKLSVEGGIASSNQLLVSFRESGINISTSNEKNVLAKIDANNQFTIQINKLLEKTPQSLFSYKELILTKRNAQQINAFTYLLSLATIGDFVTAFNKRKLLNIPTRCFLKSINLKFIKFIKHSFTK